MMRRYGNRFLGAGVASLGASAARSLYKRFSGSGSTRKEIKKIKKKIRSLTPEIKVISSLVTSGTASYTATGTFTILNPIAQGDEYNQRTGRVIRVHELLIRGFWYADSAVGASVMRLIVGADTACNNGTLSATEGQVFETATAPLGRILSYFNADNVAVWKDRAQKDLHILHDQHKACVSGSTFATSVYSQQDKAVNYFQIRKRFPTGHVVNYDGSASGSSGAGCLFFYFQNSNSTANASPQIAWMYTLRYSDC